MATSSTQRDAITFDNDDFEVGVVIRLFLDAIYTGSMEDCADSLRVNSTMHVVDFARKWECQGVLDMIGRIVKNDLNRYIGYRASDNVDGSEKFDLLDLFLLAVKLELHEVAGDCLRQRPGTEWGSCDTSAEPDRSTLEPNTLSEQPVESLKSLDSIAGFSVFTLAASPYAYFLKLQPNIVWALLRSSHLAMNNINGKAYEERFADEFVRIMRLACKYLSSNKFVSADGRPFGFQRGSTRVPEATKGGGVNGKSGQSLETQARLGRLRCDESDGSCHNGGRRITVCKVNWETINSNPNNTRTSGVIRNPDCHRSTCSTHHLVYHCPTPHAYSTWQTCNVSLYLKRRPTENA